MCPPHQQFVYHKYFTKEMDDIFIDALVVNLTHLMHNSNTGLNVEAICFAQRTEEPFTLAYHWKLEPKWEKLKIIFGQLDNEVENSSNVDVDVDSGSISPAANLMVSDYDEELSSGSSIQKSP
ncbi:UNVERIFIED_CONTAM: hypothetical protein Sindi_2868600 [Sesamum indicum]